MKRQILAATLLGLSLVSGGCTTAISSSLDSNAPLEAQAATPTLEPVVSTDGNIQLTIPDTWKSAEISEAEQQSNIVLKLTTDQGELGLMVMAMPKIDGMTFDIFQVAVSGSVQAVVGDADAVSLTSLEELSGLPALQYEGVGTFDDRPLRVQATGVEATDTYYNILVAGDANTFAMQEDNVQQMVNSFTVNAPQ
ncbi:MAG TPA: hypothetical protein V6D20_08795 [Candidatus Obscuribacterales bacterium]